MTPEQRLERAERILVMLARAGRKARSEWRERVNIVISMHERHAEESRAESHALNEKINILINSQIETAEVVRQTGEAVRQTGEAVRKTGEQLRQTDEQLRQTDAQLRQTDAQLRNLGTRHDQEMAELRHSQKLTDQALRAFIDSLRKKPNGNSSN